MDRLREYMWTPCVIACFEVWVGDVKGSGPTLRAGRIWRLGFLSGMRRHSAKKGPLYWRVILFFFLCFSAICSGLVQQGFALEPEQILVLANKNAWGSVGLAQYYMKKRAIPEKNLLQLWVTDKEWCSREEYDQKVVPRVRDFL
jgi:hypothetical protein